MMSKLTPHPLLIVAHPDDETIFFAGRLLKAKEENERFKVICLTDGNADGHGAKRAAQFKAATQKLGVQDFEQWDFPDVFENRLAIDKIADRLQALAPPSIVYTHGPLGEYGHPHHQDTCAATFEAFCPDGSENSSENGPEIWSTAYNCFPEKTVALSTTHFQIKCEILSQIYLAETRRFSSFLPATAIEGFVKISKEEVDSIYQYFFDGTEIKSETIKVYRWFLPYLERSNKVSPRPF